MTYKSGFLKKKITKSKKCDFRKMPKINNKLTKRPVKRLETGPKEADSPKLQRMGTCVTLGNFVGRLADEDIEIEMSKAKIKFLKNENLRKPNGDKGSSKVEDCLVMLETLRVYETAQMERRQGG